MQHAHTLAPGLHWLEVRRLPARQAMRHGVPLFVGFGRARTDVTGAAHTPPVLAIDQWSQFDALMSSDGWLDEAVRGFFANGGRRCLVLPVQRAQSLAEAFRPGGVAEDVDDADLVCVPDAADPQLRGRMPLHELQAAVIGHCERMGDRMAILDPPLDDSSDGSGQTTESALRLRAQLPYSRFAALYAPAIRVEAPRPRARTGGQPALVAQRRRANMILVPPCGHVAGIYARTDARTGVHKAPANETVEGVLQLQHEFDEAGHARHNEAGINCIRSVPGRGIRVMGARTLDKRSDWLYVPVSRLFIELARRLGSTMRDVVFETHTPELWASVRQRIAVQCSELMNAGALAAARDDGAFYVKCDAETNPPAVRDAGQLIAEVGLAASVPAEFVVVRITHDASGIAVTGT